MCLQQLNLVQQPGLAGGITGIHLRNVYVRGDDAALQLCPAQGRLLELFLHEQHPEKPLIYPPTQCVEAYFRSLVLHVGLGTATLPGITAAAPVA